MNGVGLGYGHGHENFEDVLRRKLAGDLSKVSRGVLKVVLGEWQQKLAGGKATGYDAYAIIEKILNGNKETLGFLKVEDPRRAQYEEETATCTALLKETVSMGLLPYYHTTDETFAKVNADSELLAKVNDLLSNVDRTVPLDDNKNKKWIGQSTGAIVKFMNGQKLDVKGEVVKEVLARIMGG
jgi:hypothetical protein